MNEWTDGRVGAWGCGLMDGDERMGEWIDGRTGERTDGRMNRWMDGGKRTKEEGMNEHTRE